MVLLFLLSFFLLLVGGGGGCGGGALSLRLFADGRSTHLHAATTTTTRHIDSCAEGSAPQVVRLPAGDNSTGGGQTVVFGDGLIGALHCSFYVFGTAGDSTLDTVVFNASRETTARRWQWQVLGSKFSVYLLSDSGANGEGAPGSGALAFDVAMFSINRVVVLLGDGSVDILQERGTALTQTAWLAPAKLAPGTRKTARIEATTAAVLVAGAYSAVGVGPAKPPARIPGVNPLSGITCPLLLAGNMDVVLESGSTDGSPSQQFTHNGTCLGWQDPETGETVFPARDVDAWICGLAEPYGLPRSACHACIVVLAPLSQASNVSVSIATGDAADCFSSRGAKTGVLFDSGAGEVAYAVGPSSSNADMVLRAGQATGHPVRVVASTPSSNVSLYMPLDTLEAHALRQTVVTLLSQHPTTPTPGIVVSGTDATATPFNSDGARLLVSPAGPGTEFQSSNKARCSNAGACAAKLAPPWC